MLIIYLLYKIHEISGGARKNILGEPIKFE